MKCQTEVAEDRELCPEVEETHAAVFGNGAPENCILVRLAAIEKQIKTVERLSWILLCGVGSLVGRIVWIWIETKVGATGA